MVRHPPSLRPLVVAASGGRRTAGGGGSAGAGHRRVRAAGHRGTGHVRIIGGRLRGRRLPVPQHTGLRPTTDRVRETLFNWLAADIPGSHCLDCFAGAGALGFEAFSRGAAQVLLLERDERVAAGLAANAEVLRAAAAQDVILATAQLQVVQADAPCWLAARPPVAFDIVFLDPPFDGALLAAACEHLTRGWLKPGAAVYLEMPAAAPIPALPEHWHLMRERTAGQVRYALARFEPA